ncbi:DUF4331 domain-containing protein [soil metagenome]
MSALSWRAAPRSTRRLLLALGLVAAMVVSGTAGVDASSHREAPLITEDPVADNTDVYAYVAPDAADSVTLISNFQGFQEPGGGPNYFRFGDDVLYEIHIDNDGDAEADVTYQFRFNTKTVDPNTYQYNTGPITNITDETWNRPQTYSVYRIKDGRRRKIARNKLTPPVNIGPRSTPNYEQLAGQAVHNLRGGGKVFAGQRDEGFYADIASIFDLGGLRPLNPAHVIPLEAADGVDTFAGYNVQSIALQVPKSDLLDTHRKRHHRSKKAYQKTGNAKDPVIGVWSTSSRRRVRVFAGRSGARPVHLGRWVQVSRLGNPLVNEVVVPLKAKDTFNSLEPSQDADVFPTLSAPPLSTEGDIPLVTDPILGEQIEALYGVSVPDAPRDDLVQVFLTGVPDLNMPANVRPAELLRLNTDIDPVGPGDEGYSTLGVLGGDTAGHPNGRRVGDDVIDIALQAVAGELAGNPNDITDGVDGNDKPYLDTFPYLGTPHQGYELNNPDRVP